LERISFDFPADRDPKLIGDPIASEITRFSRKNNERIARQDLPRTDPAIDLELSILTYANFRAGPHRHRRAEIRPLAFRTRYHRTGR